MSHRYYHCTSRKHSFPLSSRQHGEWDINFRYYNIQPWLLRNLVGMHRYNLLTLSISCRGYCPACRTTLIATRFRVAVICPIIQVPHCIRVFFYFVWFVFINHIFQFYYELCTYCNILDIYLSWNLNFVNYVLFYMKLLNYLFFSMFGSVLESCELTGVCLLLPWLIKWK